MQRDLAALVSVFILALPLTLGAQEVPTTGYSSEECPSCAEWNARRQPFKLFGNSYYVGTQGLSAVLITSSDGHVLIDGGLPDSAPIIIDNVRALGFRIEDVELIVNSHAHFDHAGGIAALQAASGAQVVASPASARELQLGKATPDDPQYPVALDFPAVPNVQTIADGETQRVGSLALTPHFTPGHTPGGTTWSWQACENDRCIDLVYADSQTPVSADDFLFTRSSAYPTAIDDFQRSFAVLEQLPCDLLITAHPWASSLWERVEARDAGNPDALIDPDACRRYAANARDQLARRMETEQRGR